MWKKKLSNKANGLKIHFNFNFYQFIFFIDIFILLINRKINILFFFFFWKNLIEKILKNFFITKLKMNWMINLSLLKFCYYYYNNNKIWNLLRIRFFFFWFQSYIIEFQNIIEFSIWKFQRITKFNNNFNK